MTSAIDFLRASQDGSGGWGYFAGHRPVTEATATVLLALRDKDEEKNMVDGGVRWLLSTQHEDGGWGYVEDDDESGWQTAWAVLALSKLQIGDDHYRRGVEWLVDVKPLGYQADDFSRSDETNQVSDPVVNSWPWYPGEATWVEPTSLAILALDKERGDPVVSKRIKHALAYLEERRCPGGGWNVGNPVMFGSALPGRAPQTAIALIAKSGWESSPHHPQDIETMQQDMIQDGSPLALGWGCLALRVLGMGDDNAASRLSSLQKSNGSWLNNNYFTGVAVMAERGFL